MAENHVFGRNEITRHRVFPQSEDDREIHCSDLTAASQDIPTRRFTATGANMTRRRVLLLRINPAPHSCDAACDCTAHIFNCMTVGLQLRKGCRRAHRLPSARLVFKLFAEVHLSLARAAVALAVGADGWGTGD